MTAEQRGSKTSSALGWREATPLGDEFAEARREGEAFDELHDHEVLLVDVVEVDDAHDAGVAQGRDRLRLVLEPDRQGSVSSAIRDGPLQRGLGDIRSRQPDHLP